MSCFSSEVTTVVGWMQNCGVYLLLVSLSTDDNDERQHFLPPPVKLDPGWEGIDRPPDELNFRTLERVEVLERNKPKDRFNLVYMIMFIHGVGILMPWNMFINAKAVSCAGLYPFLTTQMSYLCTSR